jgi:endoglucanase
VITIADRSIITHPKIMNTLLEAAEAEGIPYQFKKIPSGGTDAGAIHLTKAGIPSGTVATPNRYIHGPAAVAHVEDLENTVRLVTAFVRRISAAG